MKRILFLALTLCGASALFAQTAEEVKADFQKRFENMPSAPAQHALDLTKNAAEREAIEFLYAYMDWPDIYDYPAEYFINNTRIALRTRQEMAWGQSVPDREWRHFVLPVRVNNENLDDFRTEMYDELKNRVKNCSMKEAILEVNHWCHEHVVYRPTDARTSSPLACMRSAAGRCGEESTFTVAALRAVGIPARQVYTPRWAHTDDNHAWVEAYADGKWYFLGACEPAATLNVAWFNQPASRGMMMNTTVLGRYKGEEQILRQLPTQTTINITENYAPVASTKIVVVDENGKNAAGATVRFGLYNYGEFYGLYQTTANEKGETELISGKGDLLVWAAKDGVYGFEKVSAGSSDKPHKIKLSHRSGDTFEVELDVVPPPVNANYPVVSPEAEAVNNRRMAFEDSVRMAYVHSWPTDEKIAEIAEVLGYDYNRILPLFKKSEGNYMSLYDLLAYYQLSDTLLTVCGHTTSQKNLVLDVLESITSKDLGDFNYLTLLEQIEGLKNLQTTEKKKMTPEAYEQLKSYVFCPRIAHEMLTAWRKDVVELLSKEQLKSFRENPSLIETFVNQDIKNQEGTFSRYICQSPQATLSNLCADQFSKGICLVAICRTLGIPARYNSVTGQFQYKNYKEAEDWRTVQFNTNTAATQKKTNPTANLSFTYTPERFMENPAYYTHFTLSRIINGLPYLQSYGEGDTWTSRFKDGTRVECGDYLLISGTRLANGSVLARLSIFPVTEDTTKPLIMRKDNNAVSVIGNFNAEDVYFDVEEGKETTVLGTTGRGYFAVGLLKANNEPSFHILHDLEQQRKEIEAWDRTILIVFASQEEFNTFEKRRNEFPNLPKNVRFGIDTQGSIAADLFGSGLTKSEERPVFIVGDTFNRVVFFSQGYTIGIGDQIIKTIGKL